MTSKKTSKVNAEITFGGADAVPADDAPATPTGYKKQGLGTGAHPLIAVVHAAPDAAEEIRTSTIYASTFGSLAPAPALLADAIDFAAAWSAKRVDAEKWREYTRQQEDLAWRFALGKLDALRPTYAAATALDPTVASRFSKVTQLFAPRSNAALKAAASRKAKKAAAAEAAKAVAEATPTAPTNGK